MDSSILFEMVLFLASAVIIVPLSKRLGLGNVLGFLVAGVLIGPWGLRLIRDVDSIRHLSELRRWAKPLQLPEERLTYHVLESDQPAAALLDYAAVNEVEEILMGFGGNAGKEALQVAAQAPCSVTIVRPPPLT